jgi:hypothetical protein
MADQITFAELTEFFSKVGAGLPCSSCGKVEWIIPPSETERVVGLFAPRQDGAYIMPQTIIPTMIVLCGNCGYIRLHSLALLWQKIRGVPLFGGLPAPVSGPSNNG